MLDPFPIDVDSLQAHLPHRPPMVWVNRILMAHETVAEAEVRIDDISHACNTKGIRQSSVLEWIAQSFGYAQAARTHRSAHVAYLAGSSQLQYCASDVWNHLQTTTKANGPSTLVVQTKVIRTLGPISMIAANVLWPDQNALIATGTVKVFVNEDPPHT